MFQNISIIDTIMSNEWIQSQSQTTFLLMLLSATQPIKVDMAVLDHTTVMFLFFQNLLKQQWFAVNALSLSHGNVGWHLFAKSSNIIAEQALSYNLTEIFFYSRGERKKNATEMRVNNNTDLTIDSHRHASSYVSCNKYFQNFLTIR